MKCRLLLLLLLAFLPFAGRGAETDASAPPEILLWKCWYDQAVHLICVIDSLPAVSPAMGPVSDRLPAIVRMLRAHPEAFREQFVQIPLLSPPEGDMGFVAELAQVAVCGSRPACLASFSATPPPAAEMARILERMVGPQGLPALEELPGAGFRPADGGTP